MVPVKSSEIRTISFVCYYLACSVPSAIILKRLKLPRSCLSPPGATASVSEIVVGCVQCLHVARVRVKLSVEQEQSCRMLLSPKGTVLNIYFFSSICIVPRQSLEIITIWLSGEPRFINSSTMAYICVEIHGSSRVELERKLLASEHDKLIGEF